MCPNVDTLFYTSNSEKEISIKTCFAHQQNIFLIFFSLFLGGGGGGRGDGVLTRL